MVSELGGRRITARQWELQAADEWFAYRRDMNSDSARFASDFCEAVTLLIVRAVGENVGAAKRVLAQLGLTLSRCDELDFEEFDQTLAYALWHEVDRYHRVTQALDMLFERGVLPIAKPARRFRMLEVGSGPAPAGYATVDYFAALGAWTQQQMTGFHSSGSVEVHTLDRGPAWGQMIHRLSEELLLVARSGAARPFVRTDRFFDVTYNDLRGFNPRELHNQTRDRHLGRLLEPRWAEDDDGLVDFDTWFAVSDRQIAETLAAKAAPPSAYDLIVVANFITNEEMLQMLKPDVEVLARSLVPGGVLLILSAPGAKYTPIWEQIRDLAQRARLEHVVDEVVGAHREPATHTQVASATINALRHLDRLVPNAWDTAELPDAVLAEVVSALSVPASAPIEEAAARFGPYPHFQVHAFKRGHRAISLKERKRFSLRTATQK
ncbi:hypothetical protein SAMN05192575_105180 [Nocardioides alpinus]|uniref:Methyltransferase domain-containing protein n=1 Tax=Nocardioides alpinus TaxID=748909 RepID=A0A1I0ZAR0_9ACTN|nr:hypothetical protein [Nocardioides alpinus]PKH40725.1 hypothetical protein CXG46_12110 [Nocardioides alpinus]SFB22725.1 hypothetical protein SAMN05192575_105180 [Nocardioides alpinus]